MANQQFCTFLLDGYFFGVAVRQVQEVIRYLEMTRVPLASPVVRGLINLRGQIVTAIDLRLRDRVTVRLSDDAAAAREAAIKEKEKKVKRKGGEA